MIGVLLGIVTFFLLGLVGPVAGQCGVGGSQPRPSLRAAGNCLAQLWRSSRVPVIATLISLITSRMALIRMLEAGLLTDDRAALDDLQCRLLSQPHLFLVLAVGFFLHPRKWSIRGAAGLGATSLWLLRVICGTRIEVRGREHIPRDGALVAGKHQSAWETFAILPYLDDPAMVLKKELTYIPFFGWFIFKFRMIAVERERRPRPCARLSARGLEEVAPGRQIVIMPEGTRRAPDAPPDYKPGAAALYRHAWRALRALCPQFRPLLAAPQVPAACRAPSSSSSCRPSRQACRRKEFQHRLSKWHRNSHGEAGGRRPGFGVQSRERISIRR